MQYAIHALIHASKSLRGEFDDSLAIHEAQSANELKCSAAVLHQFYSDFTFEPCK